MAYTKTTWLDRAVQFARRYIMQSNGGGTKNLLPPFNESWVLHENTRMKQANYVGKIGGSTVVNPHIGRQNAATSLQPVGGTEFSTASYDKINVLDANLLTYSNATNGGIVQQYFAFDLIEHVIRTYGVGVFGSAATTAERVAWLKVNITKVVGNWWGYGSGPAGNNALFRIWHSVNGAWDTVIVNHTGSTVAKNSRGTTVVSNVIDPNGFVHFLAYADASNGTTASTINTDFVELEIYMAAGSIPQADYDLTLNATASFSETSLVIPAVGNTAYTFTGYRTGRWVISELDVNSAVLVTPHNDGTNVTGTLTKTFTTNASTRFIKIVSTNVNAGLFTFTNPQLELGSSATAWEPMARYTITQSPGIVTQAGTAVNAAALNKLEVGVFDAHTDITSLKASTFTQPITNLNNITQNGRYYATNTTTNTPTVDFYHVEHQNHDSDPNYMAQIAYHVFSNKTYTRRKNAGVWGAWIPLHQSYIVPSDAVLLSAPTERNTTGGSLKTFRIARAGRYRLKGEYRNSSGGGPTSDIHLRLGIASAANLTADQMSLGLSTTSSTYVSFSVDLPQWLPENCTVVVYSSPSGGSTFLRNVTLCGSEGYDNTNVSSVID